LKNTLTFIDLDDTLFFTKAKILVKNKKGDILHKLTNQEYNSYILSVGESFDFSEFKDTEIFVRTSEPNQPMIDILQELFNNTKSTNSEVYLLTARQDFDDKDKFLSYLIKHGIEVGHKNDQKIHVIRAGNIHGFNNAHKKYQIIKKILEDNTQFKTVQLYDDSKDNLSTFSKLKLDYPEKIIEPFLLKGNKIKRYNLSLF